MAHYTKEIKIIAFCIIMVYMLVGFTEFAHFLASCEDILLACHAILIP